MDALKLLGLMVRDRVTGMQGIATSVSYDLYGCVQVLVNPGLDKDGRPRDMHWFDFGRIKAIGKHPVMPVPSFERWKGPENKPIPRA